MRLFLTRILVALLLAGSEYSLAAFTPPSRLLVVSDEAYPPYLFRTDEGKLQGIIVDKWALWSSKTGVQVTVEGMEWLKAQRSVVDGKADVIDVIGYNASRTKLYEFSPPYGDMDTRVYFQQSITGVANDVASMRGFTIGAKAGSACATWLEDRGIKSLVLLPTSDAVVDAARTRDFPLFCLDGPVAQYFLFKHSQHNEFRQTDPLFVAKIHWAVAKGRTELRDFIQAGFARISASELGDIETHWIGKPTGGPIDPRYFYYFAAIAVALLTGATLLVAWNRSLSLRVSTRTADLRSALESAQMHEQRFSQLFRLSPDATVVTTVAEGRVIEANDAFCRFAGRKREAVIGRKTTELGFWQDGKDRKAMLVLPTEGGGVRHYERRMRTPTGEEKDVLVRAARVALQGEEALLVLVQDITERRRALRLLEESEQRLAKVISASPEAITLATIEDGTFIEVNPAGEKLSGYSRAEMIGRSALAMGFYPDPEERQRLIEDLRRKETIHGRELHLRRKDGEVRDVLASAALIEFGGRQIVLFEAIDITERKQAERTLREQQELLRELSAHHDSVREEERAHIAREIHDEMGQALTALKMDLSVLGLETAKDAPRVTEQVRVLKGQVDDVIQLVRDVATSLRPAALDLGLVSGIEWLVEEFQKRNGIPCRVAVEGGEIDLDADRGIVLFRILQESLTNIARHADANHVEIALRHDSTHVRLDVKDDGRGFDPAVVRDKKTFGLLGIRERAIMLHGTLTITSVPGQGTQVSMSIPLGAK